MKPTRPDLWAKLAALPLDVPGATLPYTAKLANAEGWSMADARRVAEEYRRFLYLSQIVAVDPVPPDPVDTAWRMHLTYTRSYWEEFAPVLDAPLHRAPALREGRGAKRRYFRGLIDAYESEFGTPPPGDIWPSPSQLTWGGVVAVLIVVGVAGAFLSVGIFSLAAWAKGLTFGGTVDTGIERWGAAVFMFFWAVAFFSPLWAWLATRGQPRLATSKRDSRGRWSFSVTIGRSGDCD